jgi:hypothetical protein
MTAAKSLIKRLRRTWPKTPRGLSGVLRRLLTFLRESGVDVALPAKTAKGYRKLAITRKSPGSTASFATIATRESDGVENLNLLKLNAGGGCTTEVAVASSEQIKSPPDCAARDLLKTNELRAEVAVVSGNQNFAPSSSKSAYLCSTFELVEWIWKDPQWVCPESGRPAPLPRSAEGERERFEL